MLYGRAPAQRPTGRGSYRHGENAPRWRTATIGKGVSAEREPQELMQEGSAAMASAIGGHCSAVRWRFTELQPAYDAADNP